MHSQNLLYTLLEFRTSYMHSQKFHLYMHSKRNHAFIKAFFLEKIFQTCTIYVLKKNHAFINAFSKRKSPKFHKCIFSQKKIIQTYIIYAFKKKSCIHKSIFFRKNLSNMHYICIQKKSCIHKCIF